MTQQIITYPFPNNNPKHLILVGTRDDLRYADPISMAVAVDVAQVKLAEAQPIRGRFRTIVCVFKSILETSSEVMRPLTTREYIHTLQIAIRAMPSENGLNNLQLPQHQIDGIKESVVVTRMALGRAYQSHSKELNRQSTINRLMKMPFKSWFSIAYDSASDPYNPVCKKRIEREWNACTFSRCAQKLHQNNF